MIGALRNFILKRKHKEEHQVLQLLKAKLNNFDVILEAGGHNGKDTLRINQTWPNATIHVFEPEPSLYEQLSKNTAAVEKIKIYSLALSDKTGTVVFHKSSG